jgi:uncharacterized protein YqiB (DUF1249 family)
MVRSRFDANGVRRFTEANEATLTLLHRITGAQLMQLAHGYSLPEASPRTFAGLMDLAEENYILLRRLIPNVAATRNCAVSRASGCLDLYLEIAGRWKFTSDLILTYRFESPLRVTREPNLNIRIYHDARTAEAMCGILRHSRQIDSQIPQTTLEHKWQLNRFLYKWLGYCLRRGHRFDPDETDRTQQQMTSLALPD